MFSLMPLSPVIIVGSLFTVFDENPPVTGVPVVPAVGVLVANDCACPSFSK